MYGTFWDLETGGILLRQAQSGGIARVVRPVFFEELDLLRFNQYWCYPRAEAPLLWAVGRAYFYRGKLVAKVNGGGFFEHPRVEVYSKGLSLVPVDVSIMLQKNAPFLEAIVYTTLERIKANHEKYSERVDVVNVAFSGGKDSLVLLDLVQRVLPPDEFVVVFGDTTMELTPTYDAVSAAKWRWANLRFFTARSPRPALVTWQEFGPPSRIHRWCCTVHKTAPTLTLLRELSGKPTGKVLVYDGVRKEESARRANYLLVSEGRKHLAQTNISPLLDWNTAEVFMYLLDRSLLLNRAYRWGLLRVGCAVCPFASQWSNFICAACFQEDVAGFLDLLDNYAKRKGICDEEERRIFITKRSWASRAGGRDLVTINKVILEEHDEQVTLLIWQPREQWLEWIKTLGIVEMEDSEKGKVVNERGISRFQIREYEQGLEVIFSDLGKADSVFRSRIRVVANKTAYCVHCKACEVECPTGALKITEQVRVDERRCKHCGRCLSFTGKGCLAAKSLSVSGGDDKAKVLELILGKT